jgi:hypothetical protein
MDKTTTDKGKKLEDFLSQEGLCISNDGTDTYLHPGNGSSKLDRWNFGSFPFEDFPCTYVRTGASQLCQIYTV